MELIHDLLDKDVLDRNGRTMGRVDGIVIEVRESAPPRVVCIEIGAAALERACGVEEGRPLRAMVSRIPGSS